MSKRLEVIIDLVDNSISLGKKKVELSSPYYVNSAYRPDNTTWIQIEFHPENKDGDLDYKRLKPEHKKLSEGLDEIFANTPIEPVLGWHNLLSSATLVFPNEYYDVIIRSKAPEK